MTLADLSSAPAGAVRRRLAARSSMSTERRMFDVGGELLMIEPSALDQVWPPFCDADDQERARCGYDRDGALAIVTIDGPLDQRAMGWWWDGYDGVARRTCAALADPDVGAVAIRIDSPGGVVAGCFEAVDVIQRAKAAAGKKIYVLVDELAASAGYALACVGDEILLPATGRVGSVGVIATYTNTSGALAQMGLRVAVVTSGSQKADSYPQRPWSDEAVGRMQKDVDGLAVLFFALVAKARGMTPEAVKALEAGCFRGAAAVAAGLADREMPMADALTHARTAAEEARAARIAAAATAPRTPLAARARAAADPEGTPHMKSIALMLGLAEEASESDILAACLRAKTTIQELLEHTGKATAAEAIGHVRGLVKTAAAYDTLVTQVATDKATARDVAIAKMFEGAVASMKRTPAQVAAAKKSIEAGVLKLDSDEALAAYQAEIDASPVVVPGASAATEAKPSAQGSLITKPFAEMSPMERHKLSEENPAAYAAARAAHEADKKKTKKSGGAPRR